ncbi:unnamed protein product [Cylindrotheca closterium]|uniref:Uncharacterized protein n=1 Tax=Cylindrotheca closterium TaxID=2856 RepID=A0AAD2PWX0_9STRA|nr:unnamed protein product [Cylindrotheca closterium]
MAAVIQFRNWCKVDLLIRPILTQHMTDVEGLDSVDSFANRTTSQVREDIKSMQRAPDPNNANATIGVTARESMTIHHLMEGDSYPLPPHPPKFNNRDGRIMMENIESWARTAYGYRGIRLDYIFRENSELPAAGDPGFLRADDGSRSIEEELVRRAAHTGAVFRRNNQKFWIMLHAVTHETDAYNHVRQFAPSLNGRAAYFALFAQYRGRGHFTNERQAAVRVLATLHWNGKAQGFTWNTFISRLIGAFNDLELNGDPCSDANKVDVLLEKTVGDSSLSNGRSHITGDAVLQSNFQGAIDYLTTQVLAAGNDNTQRRNGQLAAFTRGGGGRGGDGRNGGRGRGNGATNRLQSNVPDRFSRNGILLNDGGYANQIWREESTWTYIKLVLPTTWPNAMGWRPFKKLLPPFCTNMMGPTRPTRISLTLSNNELQNIFGTRLLIQELRNAYAARPNDRAKQNSLALYECLSNSVSGNLYLNFFSQSGNLPAQRDGPLLFKAISKFTTINTMSSAVDTTDSLTNLDPALYNFNIVLINQELNQLFVRTAQSPFGHIVNNPYKLFYSLKAYEKIKRPCEFHDFVVDLKRQYTNGTITDPTILMSEATAKFNELRQFTGKYQASSFSLKESVVTMLSNLAAKQRKIPKKGSGDQDEKKQKTAPEKDDSKKTPPFLTHTRALPKSGE